MLRINNQRQKIAELLELDREGRLTTSGFRVSDVPGSNNARVVSQDQLANLDSPDNPDSRVNLINRDVDQGLQKDLKNILALISYPYSRLGYYIL